MGVRIQFREHKGENWDYTQQLSERMHPREADIAKQHSRTVWHRRTSLINWLLMVHSRHDCLPETLFLCVNYLDRYLSRNEARAQEFPLLGMAALLLAAKYQGEDHVQLKQLSEDLLYVGGTNHGLEDLRDAELNMAMEIDFEMRCPGPFLFLGRISKADNDYDLQTDLLARYYLETTIADERFLQYKPPCLAAGAYCLARIMLKKKWVSCEARYSGLPIC